LAKEAAAIDALRKAKRERAERWRTSKNILDSAIAEIQKAIKKLEQDITNLNSIVAAEAAEEAWKNGWTAWFLSPVYKQVEDSEEEKARKERGRQERRIKKDLKERWLQEKQMELHAKQNQLKESKGTHDKADRTDDWKISVIEARISAIRAREREEAERAQRAQRARDAEALRKLQQEALRAAEALRKQQAEARMEELRRQQEEDRRRQAEFDSWSQHYSPSGASSSRQGYASAPDCVHEGWWDKVHGRAPCPECADVWTYLLQCPGCATKACPKCQSEMRPRYRGGAPRVARRSFKRTREQTRAWNPPELDSYFDYD
jgi:hypothetical protein